MFTLVIGGAASGKSAWAETRACSLPGQRIYLATMQPYGEESRARIEKHRAQRAGKGFVTLERYTDLAGSAVPTDSSVLLEDLANLLANETFSRDGGGSDAALRGVESLRERCAHLTVVTNELFSGGASYEGETLLYLRELARLNRLLAARADCVVELVCGLPNVLKGEVT
ncbi:MAG: bifunctional adenosylcobinamide kinase/adenosylcobinamide-phosphate guanylyltransferase [Oscillospiraceae bacterium]|nr:bifunctional adenosylcobinamide kinase/adenosylcobinamide-phosphate guanylyltransferase [Oscillospiraceae bacterium]